MRFEHAQCHVRKGYTTQTQRLTLQQARASKCDQNIMRVELICMRASVNLVARGCSPQVCYSVRAIRAVSNTRSTVVMHVH